MVLISLFSSALWLVINFFYTDHLQAKTVKSQDNSEYFEHEKFSQSKIFKLPQVILTHVSQITAQE